MDTIKVKIDKENNKITVLNNGRGIPVEIHKKEKVYVPELIFGHLLTSSNYDDEQKKVTGGRNGYGAKLCNIFSNEFIVETADSNSGMKYVQKFLSNMSQKTAPKITSYSGKDYTQISFVPDLDKFGMVGIDDDIDSLMKKRVYDLCGTVKDIKVFLNEERLKIKNFRQYIDLYLPEQTSLGTKPVIVHEILSERWEIAFTLSDGQFQQVSFANSICTSKGGTHVNAVAEQICHKLVESIQKKNKGAPVKPFQIKNHMWLFVNCLIENPAFDSQTKENMTLKASSFGSKVSVTDEFMNKVRKSGIVENILSWAKFKADQLLKKTDGHKKIRISGISKLDDANNAGTRLGKNCTLILTEGDSAKTLAVSGLGVVGRDNYGVFPLRGKLLNVREANHKSILDNAEINAIKQILGLQHGKKYEDCSTLRYGHIMIMTDQDHDGSHIKGLIINLLDHFWPELLKVSGFLHEFITPIVKVTKGGENEKNKNRQEISFYTIPEYETWKESHNDGKGWSIKYYKGLGTSTKDDAKKYFSNLRQHKKQFDDLSDNDRSLIDMAFNKKKSDDRKEWLRGYIPGTFMDNSAEVIKISDFINKELILFSMADNTRSIPSVVDGLKPGLRKILFACFKRNLVKGEIKVAQLSGYVAEHSAYHHGEQSLQSSIVGLAQNFVGSNNINLLEPRGQFGSRLQGGKDSASARYIFT
jgi:DNA topoisomerase-2